MQPEWAARTVSCQRVNSSLKFLHTEFGFKKTKQKLVRMLSAVCRARFGLAECAAYIDSAGGKQAEPLGLTE